MIALEISLLGPSTILSGGRPFETDRRKAVALLAYLIVSGKPQPREHLAATFWPDYEHQSAFSYLRRTLFELNRGLGKEWLIADRQTAGFAFSAEARIDTVVFESELAAARSAEDPLLHLEAAAAQYQGEFMAGFFLQDTESFEYWLRLQRENYRREYASVLERLAGIYEGRGSWEAALRNGLAWVGLDDFDEAAHRALMRSYAGMGERSRAIRQYELCAQVLKDQLGVKPLPETTALYDRIRQGDFESTHPAQPPATEVKSQSGLHLPMLTTPFIGRRTEIEQVKELILDPDNRLVTLFGPGGIGKTRLSIQVASEIGDRCPDGIWFVPLANVQSTQGLIQEVAKTLNLTMHRDEYLESETPGFRLVEYLEKKRLLLILDNIDHLATPETADLLVEILTGAGGVKLLVTSRVRLNLPAEQVFPMPGMHTPTLEEVAAVSDPEALAKLFSAVQLFLDRARRIQPDFRLSQENAPAVAGICQMVGGMPLGIELAASWLELLPPHEIEAEIRRSLDFLETDQTGVPDRQRSIRAVFDYSWKLLTASERQTFLSLCVFVGSFTREAAQRVSGATLRGLLSLANKSWMQQGAGGRFQLHPLLQHYGLERLRQDELAWHQASDRHAVYYAGFVAELSLRMRRSEQLAALEDFSKEFDTNIKAAWEWLVSAGHWAKIREQMITGLFQFGMIRWRGDELIDWMRNARLKLAQPSNQDEWLTLAIVGAVEVYFEENWGIKENMPDQRLIALWQMVEDQDLAEAMGFWFVVLGKVYVKHHRDPRAEERILAAVEGIRDQGDDWWLGITLLIQSFLWGQHPIGRLVEKLDQNLQEALSIFRGLGTVYEQGGILSLMADDAFFKKMPLDTVADLLRQTQQFYWRLNDLFGVGTIYQKLSNLNFMEGRPAEGFTAIHEMQHVFEQLGDQHMLAESLHWESLWAARYSTSEHAMQTRQRSADLSQKARIQTNYFWNLYEFGEIHRIFGDFPKALEYYEEAHLNFERINLLLGLGYYQRARGDLAMHASCYADAREHYQTFQSYAEQDNHIWSMVQARLKLAWANAHLGELEQARRDLYNCLSALRMGHDAGSELMAYLAEVRCLAEEKEFDRAVALAAFVADNPFTWKETGDLARALLADLAEKLDDQTFQAATSRLQGQDLRQLTAVWLTDYEAQVTAQAD